MGQVVNYYLGEVYLCVGDCVLVWVFFGNVKWMNYDCVFVEEVNFNYGKLLYEMKDLQEVIVFFQEIIFISLYYVEVQILMGEIFLSYCNYEQVLSILD